MGASQIMLAPIVISYLRGHNNSSGVVIPLNNQPYTW